MRVLDMSPEQYRAAVARAIKAVPPSRPVLTEEQRFEAEQNNQAISDAVYPDAIEAGILDREAFDRLDLSAIYKHSSGRIVTPHDFWETTKRNRPHLFKLGRLSDDYQSLERSIKSASSHGHNA